MSDFGRYIDAGLSYGSETQSIWVPGHGFVTTQDCEPYLEYNKKLTNEPQKSDWGRHVGRVPVNVVNEWYHEYAQKVGGLPPMNLDFYKYCRRKLEDPNYKYLRVDGIKPSQVMIYGTSKL